VARIAINAVVDIPADVRVLEIGGVVVPMASGTLEDAIVAGIRVAGRTDSIGVPVIGVEPGVIEGRASPSYGCVAGLASRCEPGGDVVGIVSPLVIDLMAAVAVGGEARIVIVYMTARAGNANVGACERKRCVVVVECGGAPCDRVVAGLTSRRETQLNVIHRCEGIVVIGLVASNAGCARQAVVIIDVAQSTAHGYVRAG
jgi:hypothetical protein